MVPHTREAHYGGYVCNDWWKWNLKCKSLNGNDHTECLNCKDEIENGNGNNGKAVHEWTSVAPRLEGIFNFNKEQQHPPLIIDQEEFQGGKERSGIHLLKNKGGESVHGISCWGVSQACIHHCTGLQSLLPAHLMQDRVDTDSITAFELADIPAGKSWHRKHQLFELILGGCRGWGTRSSLLRASSWPDLEAPGTPHYLFTFSELLERSAVQLWSRAAGTFFMTQLVCC